MELRADVKVNLKPLERFKNAIHTGLATGSGPILKALKQWAARYRGFVQERFDTFSKGGGDWPDLAPSTKRRRRKGGTSGRFSILRDTSILFGALDIRFHNQPGALEEKIPFGVRVGFGGPARHPDGEVTIADLANIHQKGLGVVPEREIIVEPNQVTVEGMAGDMLRAVETLRKDSER